MRLVIPILLGSRVESGAESVWTSDGSTPSIIPETKSDKVATQTHLGPILPRRSLASTTYLFGAPQAHAYHDHNPWPCNQRHPGGAAINYRYETTILGRLLTIRTAVGGCYEISMDARGGFETYPRTFRDLCEAKAAAHTFVHTTLMQPCRCDGIHWLMAIDSVEREVVR